MSLTGYNNDFFVRCFVNEPVFLRDPAAPVPFVLMLKGLWFPFTIKRSSNYFVNQFNKFKPYLSVTSIPIRELPPGIRVKVNISHRAAFASSVIFCQSGRISFA